MKTRLLLPLVPAALAAACKTGGEAGAANVDRGSPARASAPAGDAGETHPFGIEDMLAMERLSDPQVSPDGKWVLFNVRTTDLAANRGRTDVWKIGVDGNGLARLTDHEASDVNARWMPDGSVAFLSSRSGSMQVWRVGADGGKAKPLTDLPVDVSTFTVFPDGERLLLALEVYPDAATLAEAAARDAERAASPVQARVYDELLFRHWDTWEDGKRSHLFVWKAGGGEPVDLMKGMDADSPTRPFGGPEELAISPDGAEVLFSAKDDGRANAWTTNVDVWRVPADGSSRPARLSLGHGMDSSPSYSPDGKTIAYLSMARAGYESDRRRLVLHDRATGAERVLTDAWDRSIGDYSWSRDGKRLYCAADDVGNHAVFSVAVADGKVERLVAKGFNASPLDSAAGIVFLHDDLASPAELHVLARGGEAGALTHFNDERVAAARTGEYEQFSFTGAHGDTVYGFLVKPADFDPAAKYPVAFLIHGGPQGSFGDHFHYRWNPQAYAGAGYAAVMIDFHGSTGYGQAFTDSINGDWGGAPYEDLMKGLDHALEAYPFLDGDRVAALGASYGGYMINWIAGQTDRFRCLVNHDGNLDERMAYFDTEELWFPEWDHGGTPWENPEGFAKHNPIDHVGEWKTPMLVIHGALDYRVVDVQGMATFTALQRRGVPSRFLYFPDENHWVLKPLNSRLWYREVIGWLDRWCKAPAERSGRVEFPEGFQVADFDGDGDLDAYQSTYRAFGVAEDER